MFSLKAQAEISNFRIISGTSNVFDVRFDQEAWGVMAGPNHDSNGNKINTTEPYNSCELPSSPILPCHPNRVDGQTTISIRFNETENFTEFRFATAIFTPAAQNTNPQPQVLKTSERPFSSGEPVILKFTWGDICTIAFRGHMNNRGQCEDDESNLINGNVPVSIGLSDGAGFEQISSRVINFRLYNPSPEIGIMPLENSGPCSNSQSPPISGVCDILLLPGDGGAFLETSLNGFNQRTQFLNSSLQYIDAFNGSSTNLTYTGIRLYFFEGNNYAEFCPFCEAKIVDLDISSSRPVTLKENKISGLTNGVNYTVLASSIDESGTVSQFFQPDGPEGYCSAGFCPTITPSQVAGVIVNSSCFITTATYGSKAAHQVQTFQKFRETFLRGHFFGDKIIIFYNSYGPYIAVFINNNPHLKPLVRVVLFPFYLFSKLSLSVGLPYSLSLLLLGLLFIIRWRWS